MRRTGKILMVRLGYNANSSSLASIVDMLLFGSGAAVAALSVVAATLFGRPARRRSAGSSTDARR